MIILRCFGFNTIMLSFKFNEGKELIEEYTNKSKGMIIIERIDPEPFTDNEDLAILYGLQGMQISQAGEKFYFGLVATNSTDDISIIPFFEQERETYLEYDLTRIINDLANHKKKKLIYLDLPIIQIMYLSKKIILI